MSVDAAQVRDACAEAARAGLHVPGSPINILLFGKRLRDESQLLAACENVRSDRSPEVPAEDLRRRHRLGRLARVDRCRRSAGASPLHRSLAGLSSEASPTASAKLRRSASICAG